MGAVFLRDLTWLEAEKVLGPDVVVVLPLGAAAKEHGPHLRLDNDERLAEGYARLLSNADKVGDIVVAPTLTYHFYPAFAEYPGSTSLRLETARDLTVDVVRSLAKHGPRRFYVLNTGVSTVRALRPAAAQLAEEGVVLRYTDVLAVLSPVESELAEQAGGTHADEIETSIMLVLAPDRVDMTKAVKDYDDRTANRRGGLTRNPDGPGTYSPTGTFGDPTLASREKGRLVVEALLRAVIAEIGDLREAPLPAAPSRSP
jgi:creatinine amidohydrolase